MNTLGEWRTQRATRSRHERQQLQKATWTGELRAPVELVLKLLSVLVVLGVVVVHLRLARFSYFSTRIDRAVYAGASFWLVLPLLIAWMFLMRAALPFVARLILSDGKQQRLGWLIFFGGWIAILAVSMAMLFAPGWRYLAGQTWLGRVVLMVIFGCLVVAIPIGVAMSAKGEQTAEGVRTVVREMPLSSMLVYGLIYVGVFQSYAYGTIPAELGGGRPLLVRVVADSAARRTLTRTGVLFPDNGLVSAQLRLLLATERSYVVQMQDTSKAIELDMRLVDALIFEPHAASTTSAAH